MIMGLVLRLKKGETVVIGSIDDNQEIRFRLLEHINCRTLESAGIKGEEAAKVLISEPHKPERSVIISKGQSMSVGPACVTFEINSHGAPSFVFDAPNNVPINPLNRLLATTIKISRQGDGTRQV